MTMMRTMATEREARLPEPDWERLRLEIRSLVSLRIPAQEVDDLVQDILAATFIRSAGVPWASLALLARAIGRNKCSDWHRRRCRRSRRSVMYVEAEELVVEAVDSVEPERVLVAGLTSACGSACPDVGHCIPAHCRRELLLGVVGLLPARQQRVARAILGGLRTTKSIARAAGIHPSDCREVIAALPSAFRRLVLPPPPPPPTTSGPVRSRPMPVRGTWLRRHLHRHVRPGSPPCSPRSSPFRCLCSHFRPWMPQEL